MLTEESYFYSAYTYLNEWIATDRPARRALAFRDGEAVDDGFAREELVKFAQAYGVIRNFKKEGDLPRLARAWDALKSIDNPRSRGDAQNRVELLIDALAKIYTKQLLSAATKFLWVRFRSPVIIYDTITWSWMCHKGYCSSGDSYAQYCAAWQIRFAHCRKQIEEASLELTSIRKFLRPNDISDTELYETVSSGWFHERVFDFFMLNEEAERPQPNVSASSVQ